MGKIASQTQWEDLASKIKAKQDKLTAGTGISIVEDPYTDTTVISASGGAPMEVTTTPVGQPTNGIQQITWSSDYTLEELSLNPTNIIVDGTFSPALVYYDSTSGVLSLEINFIDFGGDNASSVEYPITTAMNIYLNTDGTGIYQTSSMNNRQTIFVTCPNGITDYSAGTAPIDSGEVFEAFRFIPGKQIILSDRTMSEESAEIVSYKNGIATVVGVDKIYRITMTGSKSNNDAAWAVEEYPFQKTTLTSTDPGEGQPLAGGEFIGVYDA